MRATFSGNGASRARARSAFLILAMSAVASLLGNASVSAAIWTGAASNLWTDSGNWSGTVPTQFGVQPIVFASAGAGNLTTNVNVGGLFFISDLSTSASATSFAINNTSGGELAVSGDVYINQGDANLSASIGYPIFFNKVANTTLTFDVDGAGRSLSALQIHRHSGGQFRPGQSVVKSGSGLMSLSGNSTYHGQTIIDGGRLNVNGTHVNGDNYQVNNGGTLGGIGTINSGVNVNAGGTLAPGLSIGTFRTGFLSINANATFAAEVELHATPAADLLNVTGTVALGGTLNLSLLNTGSGVNSGTFLLIANDGVDPITGSFAAIAGLPSGYHAEINSAFSGVDSLGRIGTGNDLAVTIVPEPNTLLAALLCVAAVAGYRRTM